jgi:outer membrane lipoprotein-sorting protein
MKKVVFAILGAVVVTVFTSGCSSDAAVARANLETAEQNFEVYRRVVFYNGITGEYILTIEGKLAIIVDSDGDLVVTVKTDSGKYLKHYLGLSDNVTYFSEALEAKDASTQGYRVIFKPSEILPTVEVK